MIIIITSKPVSSSDNILGRKVTSFFILNDTYRLYINENKLLKYAKRTELMRPSNKNIYLLFSEMWSGIILPLVIACIHIYVPHISASHFRGGIFSWRPGSHAVFIF